MTTNTKETFRENNQLLKNLEDMFPLYLMHSRYECSTAHFCVIRIERVNIFYDAVLMKLDCNVLDFFGLILFA